ncbi:MAG TPA: tetratricopeptide repeat protein [Pyrinomonadaceae bacterium]|jgi:tetratricopeptide (TPR) repeat protein
MAKTLTVSLRWLGGACCALILSGAVVALAPRTTAQGQNQNSNQAQPKKKKLPPGAKGFEQYAGRDASDKLITGGATRGGLCPGCPPPKAVEVAITHGLDAFFEAEQAAQPQEAAAKYKEAEDAFRQATVADPKNFKAWSSLAWTYETEKKYKEAADAYRHAVKLTPAAPAPESAEPDVETQLLMAYFNLGNVLAADNQHAQAVEAFRQVSSVRPAYPQTYYNIGLSYVALGGHDQDAINAFQEAVTRFKALVAKDPDYSNPVFEQAYYNLGLLYSKSDKPEDAAKAAEAFRQAVKLDPNHAEARYNLGLIYYLTDNRPGLIEQQKALLTTKPELAKELAKLMSQ